MDIKIPDLLLPIFDSNHRYIVVYGGRGSGKSHSVATYLLLKSMERKTRILCVREIQNSIRDSVWKLLCDKIFEYEWDDRFTIKNDSIIANEYGSEFLFKGLSRNINDVKSMEGIQYAWGEEAHSISRPSLVILIPTILRTDDSQIIFTYNPTNEDDPVHADYTLSDRADVLRIECNHSDNPLFPQVLKDEMNWDKAHDIDKYYHVWEGQCVKHSEAQVFYKKWIVEDFETPADVFFYLGADWGFSIDPSVLLRCFVIDKFLYIDYEVYGVGIDIDRLPDKFKEVPLSDKFPIIADSARPETISYIKQRGFNLIRGADKGKGSVEDGIAFIRQFDSIKIHSRCKNVITEFRLYSYKVDSKTGTISNKLEDKNNHCIDALRYALEDLMQVRQVQATKSLWR